MMYSETTFLQKQHETTVNKSTLNPPPEAALNDHVPTYRVTIERHAKNNYIATCDDLGGVVVNGHDEDDVLKRVCLAIKGMLMLLDKPYAEFKVMYTSPS